MDQSNSLTPKDKKSQEQLKQSKDDQPENKILASIKSSEKVVQLMDAVTDEQPSTSSKSAKNPMKSVSVTKQPSVRALASRATLPLTGPTPSGVAVNNNNITSTVIAIEDEAEEEHFVEDLCRAIGPPKPLVEVFNKFRQTLGDLDTETADEPSSEQRSSSISLHAFYSADNMSQVAVNVEEPKEDTSLSSELYPTEKIMCIKKHVSLKYEEDSQPAEKNGLNEIDGKELSTSSTRFATVSIPSGYVKLNKSLSEYKKRACEPTVQDPNAIEELPESMHEEEQYTLGTPISTPMSDECRSYDSLKISNEKLGSQTQTQAIVNAPTMVHSTIHTIHISTNESPSPSVMQRPPLCTRLRNVVTNFFNFIVGCLHVNRDCIGCLGFFIAFVVSASFLTAFFYRTLSQVPDVYYTDTYNVRHVQDPNI